MLLPSLSYELTTANREFLKVALGLDETQLDLKSSLTELAQNILQLGQTGFDYAKEFYTGVVEGGVAFSFQWEDMIEDPLVHAGEFLKGIGSTFKLISRAAYEAYATEYYSDLSASLRAIGEYEFADEMRLKIQNELQQTNLILEGILDKVANGAARDHGRWLAKISLFKFTPTGMTLESLSRLNKILKESKVVSNVAKQRVQTSTKQYRPKKVPTTMPGEAPLSRGAKTGTTRTSPRLAAKRKFGNAEQAGRNSKRFAASKKIASGNNFSNQTREQLLKSKKSFEKLIEEHKEKLEAYIKNPDRYDNLGRLKNAPSEEVRKKMIAGRIEALGKQIKGQAERLKEANYYLKLRS